MFYRFYRLSYSLVTKLGVDQIIKKYYNLSITYPIPISVSHGVDYGQISDLAMDSNGPEPLHWSYNDYISQKGYRNKVFLKMPHPFLMVDKITSKAESDLGSLVIGPPPGEKNDQELLKSLIFNCIEVKAILIKNRGEIEGSVMFWEKNGFTVYVLDSNADHYFQMHALLNKFNTVIGCTFSSILVFAAYMKKNIKLLLDYRVSYYEIDKYHEVFNYNNKWAQKFIDAIYNSHKNEYSNMSESILGHNLISERESQKSVLLTFLNKFNNKPLIVDSKNMLFRLLFYFYKLDFIQILLKKIKTQLTQYFTFLNLNIRLSKKNVSLIETMEFDVYLNGINQYNYTVKKVPFVRGVTEPGQGT